MYFRKLKRKENKDKKAIKENIKRKEGKTENKKSAKINYSGIKTIYFCQLFV